MAAEVAAKKAGTTVERLRDWESGKTTPTINQLRNLGKAYKRPWTVFYLEEPPEEVGRLRDPDFRRVYHRVVVGPVGPDDMPAKLVDAVGVADAMRDAMLELAPDVPKLPAAGRAPRKAAIALRSRLGLTWELQQDLAQQEREGRRVLDFLRTALDEMGVLTLQFPGVSVEDARGFSLRHDVWSVIAVNSRDAITAKVFTIAHELGHLVSGARRTERQEEVWCNGFAGEFVLPRKRLPELMMTVGDPKELSIRELRAVGRRIGVSAEVVGRRLADVGMVDMGTYRGWRSDLRKLKGKTKPKKNSFVPQPRVVRSQLGGPLIARVAEAHSSDRLSTISAARVLGVRPSSAEAIMYEAS